MHSLAYGNPDRQSRNIGILEVYISTWPGVPFTENPGPGFPKGNQGQAEVYTSGLLKTGVAKETLKLWPPLVLSWISGIIADPKVLSKLVLEQLKGDSRPNRTRDVTAMALRYARLSQRFGSLYRRVSRKLKLPASACRVRLYLAQGWVS